MSCLYLFLDTLAQIGERSVLESASRSLTPSRGSCQIINEIVHVVDHSVAVDTSLGGYASHLARYSTAPRDRRTVTPRARITSWSSTRSLLWAGSSLVAHATRGADGMERAARRAPTAGSPPGAGRCRPPAPEIRPLFEAPGFRFVYRGTSP